MWPQRTHSVSFSDLCPFVLRSPRPWPRSSSTRRVWLYSQNCDQDRPHWRDSKQDQPREKPWREHTGSRCRLPRSFLHCIIMATFLTQTMDPMACKKFCLSGTHTSGALCLPSTSQRPGSSASQEENRSLASNTLHIQSVQRGKFTRRQIKLPWNWPGSE